MCAEFIVLNATGGDGVTESTWADRKQYPQYLSFKEMMNTEGGTEFVRLNKEINKIISDDITVYGVSLAFPFGLSADLPIHCRLDVDREGDDGLSWAIGTFDRNVTTLQSYLKFEPSSLVPPPMQFGKDFNVQRYDEKWYGKTRNQRLVFYTDAPFDGGSVADNNNFFIQIDVLA